MKLPKEMTEVTPVSKIAAILLFISLPFIAFIFGVQYQKSVQKVEVQVAKAEMELGDSSTTTDEADDTTDTDAEDEVSVTYRATEKETTFDCKNIYTGEVKSYTIGVSLNSLEVLTQPDCGIKVTGDGYSFNVSVSFEGNGGTLASQPDGLKDVSTSKLAVKYLDSDSTKSVTRYETTHTPNLYTYISYFEQGEANCDQWTTLDPFWGCGIDDLNTDAFAISVSCEVTESSKVAMCDELIDTLYTK